MAGLLVKFHFSVAVVNSPVYHMEIKSKGIFIDLRSIQMDKLFVITDHITDLILQVLNFFWIVHFCSCLCVFCLNKCIVCWRHLPYSVPASNQGKIR